MCNMNRNEWNEKFVSYVMLRTNISKDNAMEYAQSLNNAFGQGLSVARALEKDWEDPAS